MSNCRQSDHSIVQNRYKTAIFARVWHKHGRIGDLDSIQGPLCIKIKTTGNMANKRTFGFFQDHSDSFQDPCQNLHKFNIFDSIWCISCQNKCQPLNFKFVNLLCPRRSIVVIYEQIWHISRNTQKGSNFNKRGSSPLKFIPEMTTTGAHISTL